VDVNHYSEGDLQFFRSSHCFLWEKEEVFGEKDDLLESQRMSINLQMEHEPTDYLQTSATILGILLAALKMVLSWFIRIVIAFEKLLKEGGETTWPAAQPPSLFVSEGGRVWRSWRRGRSPVRCGRSVRSSWRRRSPCRRRQRRGCTSWPISHRLRSQARTCGTESIHGKRGATATTSTTWKVPAFGVNGEVKRRKEKEKRREKKKKRKKLLEISRPPSFTSFSPSNMSQKKSLERGNSTESSTSSLQSPRPPLAPRQV